MSQNGSLSIPTGNVNVTSLWVKYAFLGSVAGLVVALGVLFAVAMVYGDAMGLSTLGCVAASCTLTALFSQPAGISGIVFGAIAGAAVGGVVQHVRHSRRAA